MFKNQLITFYLLFFVALSVLLKLIGFIDSSFTELISYALIFYGVGTVYVSMGKNKKNMLFVGAASFLVGVEFFIISNYDILNLSHIVLPSIFFVIGTAFLVLFIDDLSNNLLLAISVIFLISGVFFFTKLGVFNPHDFFKSTLFLSLKYWPLLIIIAALILLLRKNNRN